MGQRLFYRTGKLAETRKTFQMLVPVIKTAVHSELRTGSQITSTSANKYKLLGELTKFLYPLYPVREFHLHTPLEVHTSWA